MTFYTMKYIQANQASSRTFFYVLMLIAAAAMIIFALLYLHNRFATRYRDLGIIALLFCFFLPVLNMKNTDNLMRKNHRSRRLYLLFIRLLRTLSFQLMMF